MQLASIDIQSRPLRLVYLVKNQADILDAVKLYTHIWGGFANAIFPIPSNDEELEKLKFALSSINPDFIFSSRKIDENIVEEIKLFSRGYIYIANDKISEFAQRGNYGPFINDLPNIIILLLDKCPTPLPESNIIFGELDGKYSFNIALQGGILNENYNRFLTEHFNSKVLTHPNNIEQLIKISFVLANTNQPLNLTRFGISKNEGTGHWYTYYRWIEYSSALYIFCEDDTHIKVACDYWNSCITGQANKLFLPKQDFLDHLQNIIDICLEIIPFLDTISVTISLEKQEAINLAHNLQHILDKKCLRQSFYIRINYYCFGFNYVPLTIYCDQSIRTTQMVINNNCLPFSPPVPSIYGNQDYLFGYNAEIYLDSGKKLFIPSFRFSKLLEIFFSKSIYEIESYENKNINYKNSFLLKENYIKRKKLGWKNLTGVTSIGQECKIYIPSDEVIISRYLKEAGVQLKINEHTRYAKGFIKRFGGVEKAAFIIDKRGADILSVFLKYKSQEALKYGKIKGFLQKECNWQLNTTTRQKELLNILSNLVEKALINRGYSANCPTCNLINFYSLEKVKEFNECQGCGESFLLPFDRHETITYKLNELALKLFETGGLAILMSINILSQIEWSHYLQLGGELTKEGEKHNFAEVDLFWLTEHCLTIVECKSMYDNGEPENISDKTRKRIDEACDQFEKLIEEVAPLVDAKVVVLSIVTNIPNSRMVEILKINELVNLGQENKIKVHLILNWELYINGQNKVDLRTQRPHIIDQFFPDFYQMEELDTVKVEKQSRENHKSPVVKRNRIIDENILNQWREEIIKK